MEESPAEAPEPGIEHGPSDTRRKWMLAAILACPPCLAAGLGSVGSGLGIAFASAGLWAAASAAAVLVVGGVATALRYRRACLLPRADG